MTRTDLLKGVGVFALVVVVVVAATAAGGTVLSGQPQQDTVDAPAYDTELLATAVGDDGSVSAPDTNVTKTIVVDQSHGNAIGESDMKPLVEVLVGSGHDVRFYTGGDDSNLGTGGLTGGSSELNATLRSADAFVVANPASEYTSAEINGIEAFADAGGRVLMLADPVPPGSSGQSLSLPVPLGTSSGSATTPGQPTNLAASFGISFGSGYLFDMTDNANNFQRIYATPSVAEPLTDGVDRLVVTDATPLTVADKVTPLVKSEDVQLSSTRRADTYSVAVRTGDVVAVGSTDFLTPSSATVADNEQLVGNIAQFLVTGNKETGAPQPAGAGAGEGRVTPPTPPVGPSTPPANDTSPQTPAENGTFP